MFTISLAPVIKSLLVESCELTSIHAGVLADSARGNYVSDTIYDDANPDQIETLPDTQIHRDVELELIQGDKEGTSEDSLEIIINCLPTDMTGYVRVYIVSPSVIYGLVTGEMVEQGIQNPHSIVVPLVTQMTLDRGRPGVVGAGVNVWPNVDLQEGNSRTIILIL